MKQLENRLRKVLPEGEIESFLRALESLGASPRKSIRFHTRRFGATPEASVVTAFEFWKSLGLELGDRVPWCPAGFFFPASELSKPEAQLFLAAGLGYVQEASAMEIAEALDVQPGMRVLDVCAAPGGKSTQLAEKLGAGSADFSSEGWLVSNEMDRDRVRVLDAILLRHGAGPRSTVTSLFSRDLAARFPRQFDRVLVDAPCSSESFFAKRVEKREDVSDSEVRRCAKKQSKILTDAAATVKPGGKLVYSTCTYSRDENEDVVEDFLAENPEWKRVRAERRFPHRDGVPGGYFALLSFDTVASDSSEKWKAPTWDRALRETKGLVRNGLVRWNGEEDLYGRLMSGEGVEQATHEMTTPEALAFCRGILNGSEPTARVVTWNGKIIGGVRPGAKGLEAVLPRSLLNR